jgi:hypothetical protein
LRFDLHRLARFPLLDAPRHAALCPTTARATSRADALPAGAGPAWRTPSSEFRPLSYDAPRDPPASAALSPAALRLRPAASGSSPITGEGPAPGPASAPPPAASGTRTDTPSGLTGNYPNLDAPRSRGCLASPRLPKRPARRRALRWHGPAARKLARWVPRPGRGRVPRPALASPTLPRQSPQAAARDSGTVTRAE